MRRALLILALTAVALPASAAEAKAPRVHQMVVFRDGDAVIKHVRAKRALVRVGRRRCAAGEATALAALVRSRVGRVLLRDYGACTRNPRDGGALFVRAIRGERNRGQDGWVYKVGRRGATAGAADPTGAFGRGRLKAGQRITWFYCSLRNGGCQRTLDLRATVSAGQVHVRVRGYDDEGKGVPVEGATVRAGAVSAVTAADGRATLQLAPGRHSLVAEKQGLVRSFPERVSVP